MNRRLTEGERALARSVFGEALDPDRVRIVSTPFRTAVTLGRTILLPRSAPDDFAAAALHLRAWLVHELVHVWQFAVAPGATLGSWAKVAASGGYGRGLPGYVYDQPVVWRAMNLEQQARAVEHAYILREGGAVDAEAPRHAAGRLRAVLDDYAGRTPFPALTRCG